MKPFEEEEFKRIHGLKFLEYASFHTWKFKEWDWIDLEYYEPLGGDPATIIWYDNMRCLELDFDQILECVSEEVREELIFNMDLFV